MRASMHSLAKKVGTPGGGPVRDSTVCFGLETRPYYIFDFTFLFSFILRNRDKSCRILPPRGTRLDNAAAHSW